MDLMRTNQWLFLPLKTLIRSLELRFYEHLEGWDDNWSLNEKSSEDSELFVARTGVEPVTSGL